MLIYIIKVLFCILGIVLLVFVILGVICGGSYLFYSVWQDFKKECNSHVNNPPPRRVTPSTPRPNTPPPKKGEKL